MVFQPLSLPPFRISPQNSLLFRCTWVKIEDPLVNGKIVAGIWIFSWGRVIAMEYVCGIVCGEMGQTIGKPCENNTNKNQSKSYGVAHKSPNCMMCEHFPPFFRSQIACSRAPIQPILGNKTIYFFALVAETTPNRGWVLCREAPLSFSKICRKRFFPLEQSRNPPF